MKKDTGLRVLYMTQGWSPHDARFLAGMVQLGHQPFYLPLSGRGPAASDLPPGVVRVEGVPRLAPRGFFPWLHALRRTLERLRPDLIHAGPLPWGPLGPALLGWRPLVSISWGSDVLWHAQRKPWLRLLIGWVLARSTLVLADCRAVAERLHAWGVPWSRVVVFPWGTDLARFSPGPSQVRGRLGLPQDAFLWVHVRTWSRFYGLPTALEGFRRALRRVPNLRLLLVGDGPLAPWVRRYLARHGLEATVFLVGRVPEAALPDYLRAGDAYVSVSRSDGSSVSLMQALAVGLPAVVSDIPGNREWVTPGMEGFLVPVEDPDALAEAMVRMARLPRAALKRMRAAARRRAEVQARWPEHLRRLDGAYRMAVEWEGFH